MLKKNIFIIAACYAAQTYCLQTETIHDFKYEIIHQAPQEFNCSSSNDAFDSMTDIMIQEGLQAPKAKDPSRLVIFGRRVGSALLMAYFAIKARAKRLWSFIIRKKSSYATIK
jgi:hypothetical protein